eukprot:TRINITY_DN12735_c0_g2_i1.p2 TRINITY_DN12735_c0_g2~~TRINITY_DN12735_c0_g2_i1.p2  ORF type:complete len:141 (+),score=3.04 TRINITY_DN12735_c0_g2_i1:1-423(+)
MIFTDCNQVVKRDRRTLIFIFLDQLGIMMKGVITVGTGKIIFLILDLKVTPSRLREGDEFQQLRQLVKNEDQNYSHGYQQLRNTLKYLSSYQLFVNGEADIMHMIRPYFNHIEVSELGFENQYPRKTANFEDLIELQFLV